mmetsp:Transcript_17056/g.43550  ORF Transcript_17056/g.43550 Transcript_17056/m.43550 type:complete len:223 (-) Transcript_17056:802-1470(-)
MTTPTCLLWTCSSQSTTTATVISTTATTAFDTSFCMSAERDTSAPEPLSFRTASPCTRWCSTATCASFPAAPYTSTPANPVASNFWLGRARQPQMDTAQTPQLNQAGATRLQADPRRWRPADHPALQTWQARLMLLLRYPALFWLAHGHATIRWNRLCPSARASPQNICWTLSYAWRITTGGPQRVRCPTRPSQRATRALPTCATLMSQKYRALSACARPPR